MSMSLQDFLSRAKDSIEFNTEQFQIDDDGVRKTVSINFPEEQPRSESVSSCPLGEITEDPDLPGYFMILPGWLHAPNISILISPQSIEAVAGRKVWITCPWTAIINDDMVMEPGGELGAAVLEFGDVIPDNVTPDSVDPTGVFHAVVGQWDSGLVWRREGCGSMRVVFCPRVFSIERAG